MLNVELIEFELKFHFVKVKNASEDCNWSMTFKMTDGIKIIKILNN